MAFDHPRAALVGRVDNVNVIVNRALYLRALIVVLLIGISACASGPKRPPVGTPEPDKFLFERGTEKLNKKDWFTAREYFRQLVDSYPQSIYRGDAKLGVGDTYLGEGTTEGSVLAVNEFKEFLSYYPTHKRAYYAQFKLAMAHFYEMRGAMRDQTETLEAIKELTNFVERYSDSPLIEEGRKRLRDARDRLGEHELGVGVQYHRTKWYPGAVERLKGLIDKDPQFTHRDAALFYLADSIDKLGRSAEALPYFDRILKEFDQSEYLAKAKMRSAAIRATMDKKSGGDSHAP